MPPLKGIDRGLNGGALKALEESGHGERIAIVDPSYAIPEGSRVVSYQGDSSAQALRGILRLVPLEGPVTCMLADENVTTNEAHEEFIEVIHELGVQADWRDRHDTDLPDSRYDWRGFYTIVNNSDESTIFLRTRDKKAYACATFLVGHSQE